MLTTILESRGPDWGSGIRTASGAPARCLGRVALAGGWSRLDLQLLTAVLADPDPTPVVERAMADAGRLAAVVQMSITLPMGTGWLISRMPPGSM